MGKTWKETRNNRGDESPQKELDRLAKLEAEEDIREALALPQEVVYGTRS